MSDSILGALADIGTAAVGADNMYISDSGAQSKRVSITNLFGSIPVNVGVTGNITASGNLVINGTTASLNVGTVDIESNLPTINNGEAGAGVTAGISGFEVDRGSSTNFQFVFRESDDVFSVGPVGSLQPVATREDAPVDEGIPFWDDTAKRFDTDSEFIFDGTNFGLGTATPTATLGCDGSAVFNESGDDVDFRVEGIGRPDALFVQGSDGNVGIGTASPTENLHLKSSVAAHPVLLIENNNSDFNPCALRFKKDGTTPADGDRLGQIDFFGDDDGGSASLFGLIRCDSSDISAGNEGGKVLIQATMAGSLIDLAIFSGYNGTVNQGEIIFNESGADIDFRVESVGHPNALFVQGSDGNVGVGTIDFGSGSGGVMGIVNATAPSGTPTGGGVLYVEAGALKYKGSSGTITTIANA